MKNNKIALLDYPLIILLKRSAIVCIYLILSIKYIMINNEDEIRG